MQVILNKDVAKLGYRGEIVNVKPGFYRNYLSPKGFAEHANEAVRKLVESRKSKQVMEKQQLLDNAKEVIAKLEGLKLTLKSKASAKGKLYGALVETDIVHAIEVAAKVKLEKEFVKMAHIKEVGEFKVQIVLGENFKTDVSITVEAE